MTLFVFLSASTWAWVVATDTSIDTIFGSFSDLYDLDTCIISSNFTIICMSEMARLSWCFCIKSCFCRFSIFREESFFEIDFFDRLSRLCCEESLDHTEADHLYHSDKLIVCTFFIDDERIFLSISFKCNFFSKVCHTIYVVHPEFIDRCESEASLKLSKFFLCTSISEGFYLS